MSAMVGGGVRKVNLETVVALESPSCHRDQGKVEGIHQALALPEHCERSLMARKGKEQIDAREQCKG